jgi:hypothetical protein
MRRTSIDVGDVGSDGDGFAARAFDFADDLLRGFFIALVVDDDRGAVAGQRLAMAAPMPRLAPVTTAILF